MALWQRKGAGEGLVHHSDRGVPISLPSATPSGSRRPASRPRSAAAATAYDNALAESVIGLYKTEVIRHEGPWKGLEEVEFATLEWVDWFNNRGCLSRSATSHRRSSSRAYYAHAAATEEEERLKQESLH